MKLSLVVPCYNEKDNVEDFLRAVVVAFTDCGYEYEIVFVDDGSRDGTYRKLKQLHAKQDCPVKVIRLSRNFGKEAALFAGLEQADGDYITLIDADLQQRPEIARSMVSILEENADYDIIAAYQNRRKESCFLRFFKKCFYALINRLSQVPLHVDASDFRTFRKCVKESILSLSEYHRFSKGIFAWVGYETCFIPYEVAPRTAGKSKWSFRKLMNYAIEGIIGFSTKPLRIASGVGILTAVSAFLYLIVVVIQKLVWGIAIPGYATAIVLILLLGGVQLCCLGIIGEYIGRIFEQSKGRPIYISREILTYEKREDLS